MSKLLEQIYAADKKLFQLKELFEIGPQYGYTESASKEKNGPRFLRITDIQGNVVNWSAVPYCKISEKEKTKYLLKKDDLVFARTGATTGMSYFVDNDPAEEAVFASYLIRLRFNKNICSPNLLRYFFQSRNYWGQVNGSLSGSAQPGINAVTLAEMRVNLPVDVSVQKKIAEILGAYDAKLENNNTILKNLELTAQTIFDEWFVKFRFPGHENIKFVESEMGKIPEGWEVGHIKDLIRVESGFPFSSAIFNNSGKYKLVTIRNVQDGSFVTNCDSRVVHLPEKLPKHCLLNSGDILLSLTGNVGRICLVNGRDYVLNQRVSILIPVNERDRAYTYFLFRRNDFQNLLISISKGTAQLNLSPVEIRDLVIANPDVKTLEKFSRITTPMYRKIVEINTENVNLKYARDQLLVELI